MIGRIANPDGVTHTCGRGHHDTGATETRRHPAYPPTLIEIPLRLREHATAQRAAAVEPQAALADIERRAMLKVGVPENESANRLDMDQRFPSALAGDGTLIEI